MSQAHRTIYACAKAAGLDNDSRRDVFERLTGKRSLSLMSSDEHERIVAEMKRLAPARPPRKNATAKRGDIRFVHVLWKLLGDAGALDKPGRAGLNAFIRRRFAHLWDAVPMDVDAMTDPKEISQVINALKEWCGRAGVELDR